MSAIQRKNGSIHVFRVTNRKPTTNSSNLPTFVSKSRTSLSAETKRCICQEYEHDPKITQEALARKYGCKRTTIAKIVKRKDLWLSVDPKDAAAKRLRQRSARYPIIENALILWLQQEQQHTIITDQMLQEKAKQCAQTYSTGGGEEFKASNTWLAKFKRRYIDENDSQSGYKINPAALKLHQQECEVSCDDQRFRSELESYQSVFSVDSASSSAAPVALPTLDHSTEWETRTTSVSSLQADTTEEQSHSHSNNSLTNRTNGDNEREQYMIPRESEDGYRRPSATQHTESLSGYPSDQAENEIDSMEDSDSFSEQDMRRAKAKEQLKEVLKYYCDQGLGHSMSSQLIQMVLHHDFS